jgi:hypothetical protein
MDDSSYKCHVVYCKYNENESPEDGSRVTFRNMDLIKSNLKSNAYDSDYAHFK